MRLRLNILIPLIRLVFSGFFLYVILIFLRSAISGKLFLDDGIWVGLLSMIVVFFLFGYFVFNFGKAFLAETKSYVFYDEYFEVIDYVRLNKERINYSSLIGYKNANYVSKVANFKEIILFIDDKRKFKIKQFSYLNFKILVPELKRHNIQYMGFNNPYWGFFKKRFYEK